MDNDLRFIESNKQLLSLSKSDQFSDLSPTQKKVCFTKSDLKNIFVLEKHIFDNGQLKFGDRNESKEELFLSKGSLNISIKNDIGALFLIDKSDPETQFIFSYQMIGDESSIGINHRKVSKKSNFNGSEILNIAETVLDVIIKKELMSGEKYFNRVNQSSVAIRLLKNGYTVISEPGLHRIRNPNDYTIVNSDQHIRRKSDGSTIDFFMQKPFTNNDTSSLHV